MKVSTASKSALAVALLAGLLAAPAMARPSLESNAREALLDMEVRIAKAELAAARARAKAARIRAQIDELREARRAETKRAAPAVPATPPTPIESPKRAPRTETKAPEVRPATTQGAPSEKLDFDQPVPLGEANPVLMVRAIVDATNVARAEHGLPALETNDVLNLAATSHARRMVESNFFSHHDPEVEALKTPSDRVGVAGAANAKAAENIITEVAIEYESGENVYVRDRAKGHFSRSPKGPILPRHTYRSFAESVVDRWMDSPGHRKNILAKDALQIGIGTAFRDERGFPTFVAVQNFQWYEPIVAKTDGS